MARNEKFNLDLNNDENFQLGVDQEEEDFVVDFGEVINTGGGTNYNELSNKPKINDVTLQGNKNGADYNLADIYSIVFTAGEQGAIYASQEDIDYIYQYVPTYLKVNGNVSGTEISQIYVLLGENNITGSYSGELIYFTYQDWSSNYLMVRIPKNASSPLNFYEYDFYTKSESDTKFQDKLVSGTNIKTINNESILGSGNLDIEAGGGANLTPLEVPNDYMNLMEFINNAEIPETYTISNDNDVTIDIDKEDATETIYVSKGCIISVYPGWSATILTGDGQYTYFNYGDYLSGGVSLNYDEVGAIIDEKLGDNVVMTNTDQTISGQKKFTSTNGTIFENGGGVFIRNLYSSPPFKIIPDNNGNFDFYYNETQLARIDAYNSILYRALRPNLNESVNFGSSSYNWNNIYAKSLVSGQITKNISKLITNDSNLIPESNNLYTLGNAGYQWSSLYLYNTLRFNPQSDNKIENLKKLTVNTVNLGGQIGTSPSWDSYKFLQYDTTSVKYKGKLYSGLDVNNQPVRGIPDTPDEGTSPINKNYADTNLQDKLTAGTGIAITNNVISSTLEGIDYEVDQELPATGEKGIIYLIPNGSSEQENIYDEYIWIPPLQEGESGRFEFIGTTQTDLTNYVDLTSAQTITGKKTFSGNIGVANEIAFSSSGTIRRAGSTVMTFDTNSIIFYQTPRVSTDGGQNLGTSTRRWNHLYLKGTLRDGNNSNYGLAIPVPAVSLSCKLVSA